MRMQVHITAGKQIKDTLAARMRDLKLGIAGVFMSAAQQFQSQARARAPSDTGKLRAGIRITKPTYRQSSTDRRYGSIRASVRTTAAYSRLVEFGTIRKAGQEAPIARPASGAPLEEINAWSRAHRNQQRRQSYRRRADRKLPPIRHGSGLAAWAERKGINRWALQKSLGGIAWAKRGGSKPHPFWYPVAVSEPSRINPIMMAMARRIFA